MRTTSFGRVHQFWRAEIVKRVAPLAALALLVAVSGGLPVDAHASVLKAAQSPGAPPDPGTVFSCDSSDTICTFHFIFYGAQPDVVLYVPDDSVTPDMAQALGVAPTSSSNGMLSLKLGCLAASDPPTAPCETWPLLPAVSGMQLVLGLGAGDWPIPVQAKGLGCDASQSYADVRYRQYSSFPNQKPEDYQLTCTLNWTPPDSDSESGSGFVPTITAYWRGALDASGGCIGEKDPQKILHFYNVVDFPNPKSYSYPFDQRTVGCNQAPFPPDNPLAHVPGTPAPPNTDDSGL